MRTFHIGSVSLSMLAVLLFAGNLVAQDQSSTVLTVPEVRQLVRRAEPGDHARLAAHFAALADRYAADAIWHSSRAQSFGGNPNRNLGTGMSTHSKRLASLNNQSATMLRELAAYHQQMASGAAATPPEGGSRFEAGAGARVPAKKDFSRLAAKAKTPADHQAFAEYLMTLANEYTTEATDHSAMAQAYRGLPRTSGGASSAAMHCDILAKISSKAAKEATAAADRLKQLAYIGR